MVIRMILIKNGTVIDPSCKREEKADLLIKDGRIAQIAPCGEIAEQGCEVLDAQGMIVAPGLVDVQTGLDGRFVRQRKVEAGSHDLHDPGGEGMRGADICSGRRWSVSRSSG